MILLRIFTCNLLNCYMLVTLPWSCGKTKPLDLRSPVFQLRAYMNEMLLDQVPVLVEMQRYLEQLSMMEPPAVKKELLLEQVFTLSFFHIS